MGMTSVIIEILDANDNPPIFTPNVFTFGVLENQVPPVFAGSVMATDRDTGSNSMVNT